MVIDDTSYVRCFLFCFVLFYFPCFPQVNLYSDPPKAGHAVHSGPNQNASKAQKLDFSQAQRAKISPTSLCPNGLSPQQGRSLSYLSAAVQNLISYTAFYINIFSNNLSVHGTEISDGCPSTGRPGLQLGEQLANILFDQTDKFSQQVTD